MHSFLTNLITRWFVNFLLLYECSTCSPLKMKIYLAIAMAWLALARPS